MGRKQTECAGWNKREVLRPRTTSTRLPVGSKCSGVRCSLRPKYKSGADSMIPQQYLQTDACAYVSCSRHAEHILKLARYIPFRDAGLGHSYHAAKLDNFTEDRAPAYTSPINPLLVEYPNIFKRLVRTGIFVTGVLLAIEAIFHESK